MMNHATFKASLFMAAGIIDHETGTRDIRRLSGLCRFMPITATLAMVAAAAMAGVPLLNGFLSKEMFFAETIRTHDGSIVDDALPYIATLAGMFNVAYSLRFIRDVFFGPAPVGLPRSPKEPPHWMRFPVELLVLICLVVGILPGLTIGAFLHTAVVAVLGPHTPAYNLAVWHGFTLPLLMSALALVGGVFLYRVLHAYLRVGPTLRLPRRLRSERLFGEALDVPARWLATHLGTRRLQPQLRLLVCAALLAPLSALYGQQLTRGVSASPVDMSFALLWAVGIACALGTAYLAKYHRLAALILMGGAGLVTCITFAWLSAPDLALTQILVEIVTTVLILLGLRWLPQRFEELPRRESALNAWVRRSGDITLALAAGAGIATIAYAMMLQSSPRELARYFLERAQPEGGGTNVINVILVDFRGFDTLGEITVLAIVALTVYALLRRFRPAPESIGPPKQQLLHASPAPDRPPFSADYLFVPSVIMRLLFPVIGITALYLFLRGHDLPGGGFVAGLTLAIAIIVQYMTGGATWVESRFRIYPVRWLATGLLLATLTGAVAWVAGYPFLTSHVFIARVPVLGELHLSSVLLFDLGVLLVVVGATVLALIALAHQSLRTHRRPKHPAATTGAH